MNIVSAFPGQAYTIEYPNGESDLVGDEPREVPETCQAWARQAIRETGRIKETKKKAKEPPSMMDGPDAKEDHGSEEKKTPRRHPKNQ